MYGGYYGMNPAMRAGYGGGPLMQQLPPPQQQQQQQQQQQPHMQAWMRGPVGGPSSSPMNMNPNAYDGGAVAMNPYHRGSGFMLMHNQDNFSGPTPGMGLVPPTHSMSSVGMNQRFGSFAAPVTNPYQPTASFSSSGAGSLHRMNSGLNFDYFNNSQMSTMGGRGGGGGGAMSRSNSGYGSFISTGGMPGVDPSQMQSAGQQASPRQQLSRQSSSLGDGYNYSSFRRPGSAAGSVHNGPTGVGPYISMHSIGSTNSQHEFDASAASVAEAMSPPSARTGNSNGSVPAAQPIASPGKFNGRSAIATTGTDPAEPAPGARRISQPHQPRFQPTQATGAAAAAPNHPQKPFSPSSGSASADSSSSPLSRQDSAMSLQRSYSIASQFYNYNNANGLATPGSPHGLQSGAGAPGMMGGFADANPAASPMSQQQQQQQYRFPGMMSPMAGNNNGGVIMTIGGLDGRVNQRMSGPAGMNLQQQQQAMMMQQRRLAKSNNNSMSNGEEDPNAAPPKGTSENAVIQEGQSMALGRKNSVQNLIRKSSEKRIGMYFKNREVTEVSSDGSTYKKEGDTGTLGKNNARARDPSLTNTVKASLLLDTSKGANSAIEVDGRTIRADKPGAEEVHKYDMRDVTFVNRATDVELSSDSLEEMRDNFIYGCNVGMIMADAGMSSARPTEWFTWLALKSVVKGTFGKLGTSQFEFTVSVCLLQDDQVMDLLADDPQRFVVLTVAESPLFGNVANGMVYVCVEDAGEFNDVLESALQRAQKQCNDVSEEHGIVLCTCVLKQVKISQTTGKEDVVVSSIFASGVGNGIIHYTRIMDKNPAEPRALFYSVLHRSVHSTALFSCLVVDEEIFNCLTTLQRFSKTETRRPKVGSTRAFVSYGNSTIPKIREDLEKAKDPRQRMMMQRQLEKLELMVADAEAMLESPANSVPKTYI